MKTKIATGLTEKGRRELAHWLADTLSNKDLMYLTRGHEGDINFDNYADCLSGHIELNQYTTKSGNPETQSFRGDEVVLEDIEVDDD